MEKSENYVALEQMATAGKIEKTAKDLDSQIMLNFMGASSSKYFTQNNYNTTRKKVPVKVGKKPGRNEINPNTGRKYKFDL